MVVDIVNETVGQSHYVNDQRDLFPLMPEGASLFIYFSIWLKSEKSIIITNLKCKTDEKTTNSNNIHPKINGPVEFYDV